MGAVSTIDGSEGNPWFSGDCPNPGGPKEHIGQMAFWVKTAATADSNIKGNNIAERKLERSKGGRGKRKSFCGLNSEKTGLIRTEGSIYMAFGGRIVVQPRSTCPPFVAVATKQRPLERGRLPELRDGSYLACKWMPLGSTKGQEEEIKALREHRHHRRRTLILTGQKPLKGG